MAVQRYSYVKDKQKQISPHFAVGEFRSFNDATGKLTCDDILIDTALVAKLESLYTALNCKSIRITSGYRNQAFELALGGVRNGQHTLGKAADIQCFGQDGKQIDVKLVCCKSQDLGFNGIGHMRTATHVDVRSNKSYFDETQHNKTLNDFYSYFGISKQQPKKFYSGIGKVICSSLSVRKTPNTKDVVLRGLNTGNMFDILDFTTIDGKSWAKVNVAGTVGYILTQNPNNANENYIEVISKPCTK